MTAKTSKALRAWWVVHKWSSLFSTTFLIVLCVTGLPLVFRDEIEQAEPPRPLGVYPAGVGPVSSLDRVLESCRRVYPGEYPQFLFWDQMQRHRVGVGFALSPDAGAETIHRVVMDDRTGEIVADLPPDSGIVELATELHENLLLGPYGDFLLGVAGLAFFASVVSGIALYGPFTRRLPFGVLRQRGKVRWLDWHNLAGIATAAWALVVGATGVVNTLEAPLFATWEAGLMPKVDERDPSARPTRSLASLDAALATTRAALPEAETTSVGFPGTRFGGPHHYLIWTRGTSALSAHLFTPALVDADAGTLVTARGLPWYLRTLEVSRPLHFGDYGGLPLKIVWALLDLATIGVLISGVYLWLRRSGIPWNDPERDDVLTWHRLHGRQAKPSPPPGTSA